MLWFTNLRKYNAMAPEAFVLVKTTWCQAPSLYPPADDTMETSGAPAPATTRPSENRETPKSLNAPFISASTRPAPCHHWVPVPRPWVDRNQSSIEKSSAIWRATVTWSSTPSNVAAVLLLAARAPPTPSVTPCL